MKKCFIALLAVVASLLGCDGPSGTAILGEIQLSSCSKDVIEIDSDGSTESVSPCLYKRGCVFVASDPARSLDLHISAYMRSHKRDIVNGRLVRRVLCV